MVKWPVPIWLIQLRDKKCKTEQFLLSIPLYYRKQHSLKILFFTSLSLPEQTSEEGQLSLINFQVIVLYLLSIGPSQKHLLKPINVFWHICNVTKWAGLEQTQTLFSAFSETRKEPENFIFENLSFSIGIASLKIAFWLEISRVHINIIIFYKKVAK